MKDKQDDRPVVIVVRDGWGNIAGVQSPPDVKVVHHNYDILGCPDEELKTDEHGSKYYETED